MPFEWSQVAGLVRHILTFGGGWLVAQGWVDEATMMELVGAAVTLFGLVWSWNAPEKK